MPQITSIEPQKRKTGRFNVFLDGNFAFGIDQFSLLESKLKVGKSLTDEEIKKIITKEEIAKLMDLATNFLSYRPRSEKETKDYLTKKISQKENITHIQAKDSPLISQIITKLKKYRYLNDFEFAKWWVDSRTRSRPKGPVLIKFELKRKGIEDNIVQKALSKVQDEGELAKHALQKKLKRWQKLSNFDFKKKVYQYLAARGFSFEAIKEAFAFYQKKR